MSTQIISIATTKGGAGKSTVTVLLASCLAITDKKKVLVLDCDTQNSIKKLRELETGEGDKEPYQIEYVEPSNAIDYIAANGTNYDYIFFDLPRFTSAKDNLIFELIFCSDFLFIPVLTGQMDALATLDFLKAISTAENTELKIKAFLNRKARRSDNSTIIELLKSNGLDVMKNSVSNLKLFSEASTIESILNTKKGKERFEPFYREFKKSLKH